MVEVDLRLFVTCRLCLDVQGHFQIDPTVQQDIKYCFDIDVEPFDGLPQLICKKCENILREYLAIKKNFTDKQKQLKTQLQNAKKSREKSPSPQLDEPESYADKTKVNNISSSRLDSSGNSNCKVDNHDKTTRKKKKVKKKRKINRLLSSSCDDSESNDSPETKTNAQEKKDLYNEDTESWAANLNKYFVCRICSQGFHDRESITKHIKDHSVLQTKYKNVFKISCLVVMEKSDKKPNLCGSNESVVYSSDSIIQNKHNPFYYIKYHPKSYSDIPNSFETILKNNTSGSECTDSEVSTRKRRRLLSRSSSETVVINRNSENEDTTQITEKNNNPQTVIDCIDLGDSSDSESYESNEKSSSSTTKGKQDSKCMHNILKMCLNKYQIKHQDSSEKKTSENDKGKEDFLQHKVLSIGRKIINNKGFNCTGLLRFLEYKDLSVVWQETSVLNASKDKYVRIASRVRENENNDTNNTGWINFSSFKFDREEPYMTVNIFQKVKALGNFKKKPKTNSGKNEKKDIHSEEQLPRISSVFSHTDLEIIKTDSDTLLLQKLLNKNPVSNPKQLPKKGNSTENYPKPMKVFSAPNTVPFVTVTQTEKNNEIEANTMPIVTSTMSLASLVEQEKNTPIGDSVNTSNSQPTYPRIKVKPVSELMPEKTTTTINSNDTFVYGVQNTSQTSNVVAPNQIVAFNSHTWPNQSNSLVNINIPQMWQNQNVSYTEQQAWPSQSVLLSEQYDTNAVNIGSQGATTSESAKEYIILDTVEFPNTRTAYPFQYLKNLLLVHNITLLDGDQSLPAGYVSLVKLKLVYQQEKCDPITLCLSLLCFKNLFCVQIKDTNLKDVNVYNLSANWQWQLLKIYNNDVIAKVLESAAKVSQETYEYTKNFFTLLRSIKSKNDMS